MRTLISRGQARESLRVSSFLLIYSIPSSFHGSTRIGRGSGSTRSNAVCESCDNSAHVRERLLHTRQRIMFVDLVFQVHVTRISNRAELLENFGDRHFALTYNALAALDLEIAQILGVHVEQPW